MGGMWIFPILMIVVVLLVVYLIFGRRNPSPPWYGPDPYRGISKDSESALDILKKRYASGEISKEEFERMKRDIL
jgi:putative membrane protein